MTREDIARVIEAILDANAEDGALAFTELEDLMTLGGDPDERAIDLIEARLNKEKGL